MSEPTKTAQSRPRASPSGSDRPDRLRVAFCIDNMNIGGTELNAVRSAALLREAGVELSVFSLSGEGPLLERYAQLDIPVDILPITSLYGPATWRAGRQLAAMVRRQRIQVVHAHDFYSNIFAAPWTRLGGARFIASRRWWEGPDRRLQRCANRASYLLASRVLANSPAVAEMLVREERVNRHRIVVVPNFLDDAAFAAPVDSWATASLARLGVPDGALVLGVVANLSPIKDHATLLRAVATLVPRWPALHVVLIGGDGGCRHSLEQLVEELALVGRIHFGGQHPTIPSSHHLFDISVLTSVSEGMPNSILEAMAAGRAVVATSVGAIPDAVLEGKTGFLVPPRDAGQLAARLEQLLGDGERRHRFGQAGRARARAEYSARAAIGRLVDAYQFVAGRSIQPVTSA